MFETDAQLELNCLSNAIFRSSSRWKIITRLNQLDFALQKNRIIFNAIKHLTINNNQISLLSLREFILSQNDFEKIEGDKYFAEIAQSLILTYEVDEIIETIIEKSNKRNLKTLSQKVLGDVVSNKSSQEIISCFQKELVNIQTPRLSRRIEIQDVEKERESEFNRNITYLKTYFRDLDYLIKGMLSGEYIVLGARPSVGKTSLITNIAYNAAVAKKKVLFLSLEMYARDIVHRIVCERSEVALWKIRINNCFDEKEREKVDSAYEEIRNLNIIFYDSERDIDKLCSIAKTECDYSKIDLIVLDYIQLVKTISRESRHLQISEISKSLRNLARDLEVPLIALSQLSRAIELRANSKPTLSDLRESGSLEEDADQVWFLYQEEKESTIKKLNIAKNRNGATGDVELKFYKEYTRFSNI